jgi:hypothetical protein
MGSVRWSVAEMASHRIFNLNDHLSDFFGTQLGDYMIEQIWTEYSPLQLPVETQYRLAFGVSLSVFLMAAFIRETVKSTGWRWIARLAGAAAFFAIAGYAKYTTDQITELSHELHAKRVKDATQISDQTRVLAVASEFSQTVGEATVSLVQYRDGRFGPVSVVRGRSSRLGDRNQPDHGQPSVSDGTIFSAGSSTVSVPTGESGIRF